MTRKAFKAIAHALRMAKPDAKGLPASLEAWQTTVLKLSYALAALYPNFDRDRFLHAVGKEETL